MSAFSSEERINSPATSRVKARTCTGTKNSRTAKPAMGAAIITKSGKFAPLGNHGTVTKNAPNNTAIPITKMFCPRQKGEIAGFHPIASAKRLNR
jgi:hypothetical protein